jgi:hypothetical protein
MGMKDLSNDANRILQLNTAPAQKPEATEP